MTDIIPNDLSHMSDEDFNALCPQGHHAPGPEPLSPAAQAVFDAWVYPARLPVDSVGKGARTALVQALRAVADQVVTVQPGLMHPVAQAEAENIRAEILAIAAELEGAGD